MKNAKDNSLVIALDSLQTMTREELRNIARQTGVKRGQNTKDTIAHLIEAIFSGKVQFKSTFVIATGKFPLPNQPVASNAIFQKKFRSYGGGDKVEFPVLA